MKVVLASRNKNKITEMQVLLSDLCGKDITVLSLDDIGFYDEIIEDADTFSGNALIKANAPGCKDYPVIADDSGLIAAALMDEPGVYSARYAGENATDEANNEKLLKKLAECGSEDRNGTFISAIACVFPDGRKIITEGECPGVILNEYRGTGGFGYDPLFYVPSVGKTFAEMTPEEKNTCSHRAKAMQNFAKEFVKVIME